MVIGRVVIQDVRPRTPTGAFPAKAAVGEPVTVSADVFRDGHDVLGARARWRMQGERRWNDVPMRETGNDRWEAVVRPPAAGILQLVLEAWTDRLATWRRDITVKRQAGQDVEVELEEGARLLDEAATRAPKRDRSKVDAAAATARDATQPVARRVAGALEADVVEIMTGTPDPRDLTRVTPPPIRVDRRRALSSAWYELFPRSEGGFEGAAKRLRAVAEMGFDVVYLPPIHPIGHTARKGRDNTLDAGPDDPGSPWAIGSEEGGYTAVHPELGTIEDFERFVADAEGLGLEVALDYALQCSPDHPWVREHPEWFHHRPDGSIKYAENPPKKYQDIYPINFWPDDDGDRVALWEACRDVLEFWIGHGIRLFRVDNPHTKPLAFWEWMLGEVKEAHPDALFLAEAFTRPKMMAKLAEVGFSQSYTYFTWRTEKRELAEYLTELTSPPLADYMRPNFWPNTPDILGGPLRGGTPAAFKIRLLLAATLVPSYGIYSGYELCENEPASEVNEEYLRSEKFEIKHRDWGRADSLAPWIARVNDIRRRHPAFAELRNLRFHASRNDRVLAYSKTTGDDVVLVVVNLDPTQPHQDTLDLDMGVLGWPWGTPLDAHDELTGESYTWRTSTPYVRLDPAREPAHVFHLRPAT